MRLILGVFRACVLFFPALFIGCGGGADVGNPDISGCVSFVNDKAAGNAMVVIGREDAIANVDTSFVQSQGDIYFCFKIKSFDTVFCDRNGAFIFDSVPPGNYVLVASRDSMLAMTNVAHNYYEPSEVKLIFEEPATLRIEPYTGEDIDSSDRFIVANLAGTVFAAVPDSYGVFTFDMVPSGDLKIVLYKPDGEYVETDGFTTLPGCSASLVVDPMRGDDYWTVKECGPRDPLGRPYVIWCSPSAGASGQAVISSGPNYDVMLQFSHPMDTRNTGNAITAVSDDSLTSIDSLWWQGSDMIYIALCTKDSAGNCSGELPAFRAGVKCSVIIDTLAQSAFGVRFAHRETVSFNP